MPLSSNELKLTLQSQPLSYLAYPNSTHVMDNGPDVQSMEIFVVVFCYHSNKRGEQILYLEM